MNTEKQQRLKVQGLQVGSVKEFLDMSIEDKLTLLLETLKETKENNSVSRDCVESEWAIGYLQGSDSTIDNVIVKIEEILKY